MNHTKPNIALHDLLEPSPRNSREVLAAMAALNFTPKQVRRAREQLGVDVERTGSGATMQSTWQLRAPTNPNSGAATLANLNTKEPQSPAAHSCPSQGASTVVQGGTQAGTHGIEPSSTRARVTEHEMEPQTSEAAAAPGSIPAPLVATEAERRRHQARVTAFVSRGMPPEDATQVAGALVLADREWRPAVGSCAQCQNWLREQCPVSPTPVTEIHECWFRRQDTP